MWLSHVEIYICFRPNSDTEFNGVKPGLGVKAGGGPLTGEAGINEKSCPPVPPLGGQVML